MKKVELLNNFVAAVQWNRTNDSTLIAIVKVYVYGVSQ